MLVFIVSWINTSEQKTTLYTCLSSCSFLLERYFSIYVQQSFNLAHSGSLVSEQTAAEPVVMSLGICIILAKETHDAMKTRATFTKKSIQNRQEGV